MIGVDTVDKHGGVNKDYVGPVNYNPLHQYHNADRSPVSQCLFILVKNGGYMFLEILAFNYIISRSGSHYQHKHFVSPLHLLYINVQSPFNAGCELVA